MKKIIALGRYEDSEFGSDMGPFADTVVYYPCLHDYSVDAAAALMTYGDIFAQYLMEMKGEEADYLGCRLDLIRRMFVLVRNVDRDRLTVPGMVLQNPTSIRWEAGENEAG